MALHTRSVKQLTFAVLSQCRGMADAPRLGMETQREAVHVRAEDKERQEDTVPLEEATESAVMNEVLPEGLKERTKEPMPDVENGMT